MSEQDLQFQITDLQQVMRRHNHDGFETQPALGIQGPIGNPGTNGTNGTNGTSGIMPEHDGGSMTGSGTINWGNSVTWYITLTGATSLTFSNPPDGGKLTLHVAGAFNPTFPATVRWMGGSTPTPTATAGKKDVYTFVYSTKESLYDGAVNLNYSTT